MSRSSEALTEIAATRIRGWTALSLAAAFLAILALGAGAELVTAGWQRSLASFGRDPRALAGEWRGDSAVGEALRPAVQLFLFEALGYGNAQVLVGADRHLYYAGDLRAVVAAAPREPRDDDPTDAFVALRTLARETEARGAGFVFMPGPAKLAVRHESFAGDGPARGPALASPRLTALAARLRAAGVDVFDPTASLRAMELAGEPAYFRADTHWNPEGFDRAAAGLAGHLRSRYELPPAVAMTRRAVANQRRGDLAGMLGLDESRAASRILYEPITLQSVYWPDGQPYRSIGTRGPVLLVGDSFVRLNFAAIEGSGDAHFAEQLAYHVGAGVELLAENDGSSDYGRRVRWIRERLSPGHRVVVLEIAERALGAIDWDAGPREQAKP